MPLDGVTLAGIVDELTCKLLGGRVDKVTQPESDEIILTIRGRGENHKLLLSANASAPRLHFTATQKVSPLQAPMFCMVLRKHLCGGKLLAITQPDFERIVELDIESPNEMGDRSVKKLIIEIMGKHSNIMLVSDTGAILDAARHISHDTSSVREVLPGKAYMRPPSNGKTSPLEADADIFMQKLSKEDKAGIKIQQALYQSFNGVSPVMASEICLLAGVAPDEFTGTLSEAARSRLYEAFTGVFAEVRQGCFSCQAYFDDQNKAVDFTARPLTLYAHHRVETFASPSAMLEAYYRQRDADYRIAQKTADLRKLVAGHMERCVKKRLLYEKTQIEIQDRDRFRMYGELLTAYIHEVEKGADCFVALSFYNPGEEVEIPLNPMLTAPENAQAYFKQYNKQKRTFAALQEQMKQNDDDLSYLESVSVALQTASDEGDIADIRSELAGQGFVKKKHVLRAKVQKKSKPLHFVSSDGFDIYVGKNNTQNDELTLRFAQNGDLWMHTKDIAGSHVIVRTNGAALPDRTISEAANLAAFYSKGRGSSQVPVDYTPVKHVKKPNGAKPGYVIYDHHKTAYVTPVETALALGT